MCANKYLTRYTWVKFNISSESGVCLQVKCPLLLSNLNNSWNRSTNFTETSKYQASWKSLVISCLMTDLQTDGPCDFNGHFKRMRRRLRAEDEDCVLVCTEQRMWRRSKEQFTSLFIRTEGTIQLRRRPTRIDSNISWNASHIVSITSTWKQKGRQWESIYWFTYAFGADVMKSNLYRT